MTKTEERLKLAMEMFRKGGATNEFILYLQELKREDELAFALVDVYLHVLKHRYTPAIRKGTRLISHLSGQIWPTWLLFMLLGEAHRAIGEMEAASAYFLRVLEMKELIGDREVISQMKLQISITKFLKAEYQEANKEFLAYLKDPCAWEAHRAKYLLGICALIRGQPKESIKLLESFLDSGIEGTFLFASIEVKALALRMLGKLPDAMETFIESARGYSAYGTAYTAFPVAKALELSRLAGLEPPPKELIRKALSLAKNGGWGEQAAAYEIEAMLRENEAEAAEGIFEASKSYLRAYQNVEAILSGLTAAWLAWRIDSPVFTKALKLVGPLVPLHPGFRADPLLGVFLSKIEPFLLETLKPAQDEEGVKAYLVDEIRIFVDGREVRLPDWHNHKAIKAFIYLILSPKHRIPVDHLFYLLWPRNAYNRKNKYGLYTAINSIRRNLGRPDLLIKKHDFYQLEDTWTDLGEIENLVRLADATTDPKEKEEYLARARELAKGELLPEFPYDKHIDEYRQYYERLRKRLGLG